MLSLFLDRRKGSVTIMLSFLLIAVLSINSTFLEASRYRGMERLYKELGDSAAFSVLSKYDRDLYKNYGLLAIKEDVGKETFLEFMESNMNGGLAEANGVDAFLEISAEDIDFEKLYTLAQEEVFAMQVNEFCAYRAPVDFINNTFDIEELMKELVKELENSLPVLNMFNNLCKAAEKIFDTFLKLSDYQEKCEALNEQWNEYQKCADQYNSAVQEREDYIAAEHEEDEDYEGILNQKCGNVKEKALELQNSIKSSESALADYYQGYKAFANAFDAMQAANVKSILSGAKADIAGISNEEEKKNAEKMLKNMENAYKNSEEMCSKITDLMDKYKEDSVRASVQALENQWETLNLEGDALEKVSYVEMTQGNIIWDTIRLVAGTMEQIMQLAEDWAKAFTMIGDVVKLLKMMKTGGMYVPEYDGSLSMSALQQLPGRQRNGNRMQAVENSRKDADEGMVSSMIAETEEVAAYIGFDTGILDTDDREAENSLLGQAMAEMLDAEKAFQDECSNLKSALGLITIIATLVQVVRTLIVFIESIINLIQVFIYVAGTGILQSLLYQKFNPAVYSTEMFSNRVTDTKSDKKLNGSFFPNYTRAFDSGSDYFEMANAEYVMSGGQSEILNQIDVFMLMLSMRMMCNLPALLMNDTLMEAVEELCATIIGAIVAVILVLGMIVLEAWLDMLFMTAGKEKVQIIKTECYISLDAESGLVSEEFKKKVKKMLPSVEILQDDENTQSGGNTQSDGNTQSGESIWSGGVSLSKDPPESKEPTENGDFSLSEKPTESGILDKYKEGLLQWGYKDHLFLLMVLFVPSKSIYARCSDLIEMQMKHERALSGKDFKLSEMATYIRAESSVNYKPLLPVPVIPGLNSTGLRISNVHYSGY